jgi:hypothetical protein
MPCARVDKWILALFALLSSFMWTSPSGAGVAFFRETCVAAVADFSVLSTRLPTLGMMETNEHPNLPFKAKSLRTWTTNTVPGQPGNGFVQLIAGSDDQPVDVCRHVSRPSENAEEALRQLQALYPPIEGSQQRQPYYTYGGAETWAAKVEGVQVFFRVAWPFLNDPAQGACDLMIIKFR